MKRRALMIDAAVELFSTTPYEDISVDTVCERAGVAHGLVSYYFGGKRGLLAAAVVQAWNELIEHARPRNDELTAAQRLRGYLHRHFEYVRRHPQPGEGARSA